MAGNLSFDWEHKSEVELFMPQEQHIVQLLHDGLRKQFASVSVQFVDCPDLTNEPFHLVTRGLSGNMALVDVGGLSNVFPSPRKEKIYMFEQLLDAIGRNKRDSLIIGAGLRLERNTKLNDFIMNAFFHRSESSMQVTSKCYPNYYMASPEFFNMQGNFFVSDGEPGSVLQVYAKGRIGNKGFVDTMQDSLREFCTYQGYTMLPIGLGGTFVVKDANVLIHNKSNSFPDNPTCIDPLLSFAKWLRYTQISTPAIAVGTFTNTNFTRNPTQKVWLTSSNFNVRYGESTVGYFHTDIEMPDTVEYLGYFLPCNKLYRFDQVHTWTIPSVKNEI